MAKVSCAKDFSCWDGWCACLTAGYGCDDATLPLKSSDIEFLANIKPNCLPVELRLSDGLSTTYLTFTGMVDGVPQFEGDNCIDFPVGSSLCFNWTGFNIKSVINGRVSDDGVYAMCVLLAEYDDKGLCFDACNLQELIEQMICKLAEVTPDKIKDMINECITAGLVEGGQIKTVIENCIAASIAAGLEPTGAIKAVIASCIAIAIGEIEFPEGLTKDEVNTCIADAIALLDFYTRSEVNAIAENLQNQISNLVTCVNANKVCIAELKEVEPIVPPTLDKELSDLTEPVCPQCQTCVVTNPDGVEFTVIATGNGDISVSVAGNPIADPTKPFAIADGTTIEICVTGEEGVNVVGGLALNWVDPDNGSQSPVDGLTYDVDCPTTGGGNTNPTVTCPEDTTITVGDGVNLSASGNDADGDTLTYAIDPAVDGLSIDGSGTITGEPTAGVGTYGVTVVVDDGNGGTGSCTFELTVEAAGNPLTAPANCPFTENVQTVIFDTLVGAYGPFTGGTGTITLVGNGTAFTTAPTPFVFVDNGDGTWAVTQTSNASAGQYLYTVIATDEDGNTVNCGENIINVTVD